MSQIRSVRRVILKWSALGAVTFLFSLLTYLVFLLPEGTDHTFSLSNQQTVAIYQNGNLGFGFESYRGGNRQGYRIKIGHLRLRLEKPVSLRGGNPGGVSTRGKS